METIHAKVIDASEKQFLEIQISGESVRIPLSEDKPNEIKSAFNKLIARIKIGEFKIDLTDVKEDLISQVAKEYIAQLNRDIHEVRVEMQSRNLVSLTPSASRK